MNEINGQLRFYHVDRNLIYISGYSGFCRVLPKSASVLGFCCLYAMFDPLLSVWRYQHGDNPEHVVDLTLRVLIDDSAEHWRAVGEWVGRVHEYETRGLAAMHNEEAS